jgi:6-phosphogluconolactonase
VLYAVSEVGNAGDRPGEVLSFAIGQGGGLALLSRVASGGGGATHLALHTVGDTLFVANFGGGQAAALPVDADGRVGASVAEGMSHGTGPHRRQQAPHPHGVTLDPSGRFLLVPDMGADRVFVHAFDPAARTLAPAAEPFAAFPAGSGPRLILSGAGGRFAYLLSELSAELFVLRWDAGPGRLHDVQRIALDPPGADAPPSAAGLCLSADGRHLYASNRATAAIHRFAIDPEGGRLTPKQVVPAGGARPWCLALSPDGRWLASANQGSGTVQLFAVDGNGSLTAAASWPVPAATGLAFVPFTDG